MPQDLLLAEAIREVPSRVLARDAVFKRIRQEDPQNGDYLIALVPPGKVMHYGSSNFQTPSDLTVKREAFTRLMASPGAKEDDINSLNRRAQVSKHILALAVSAETPARLDNALGALTGLREFSAINPWSDIPNAEYLVDSAIQQFLSSRKVKPVCSIAAEKLAQDIITRFNAKDQSNREHYFIQDLAEDYFKEYGKYYKEALPYLAETFIYLVLNPDVPRDLSFALLRNTSRLGIGHLTEPKPFFARSTSYWQGVNASWVYPDIKVDVDPRELREKELEQTNLDQQAVIEALQQTVGLLQSDNTGLRNQRSRLQRRISELEGQTFETPLDKQRPLTAWERAAKRLYLDPKLFTGSDREFIQRIISGYRKATAAKYQRAAETGNAEANERLKQIYGDLDEIARHFDVK